MTKFEYDGDTLVLGVTEGGGAPMLIIDSGPHGQAYYVFSDPKQVTDFIEALRPYSS